MVRRREWLALAGLGVCAVIAYAPALRGAFAYDDFFFVVENDAIKVPARALEWISSPAAASEGKRWGTIFRPVRTVSYGLDFAAWRLNPVGFHLTQLLLHLVAVAGTWAFARRLTGSAAGALCGAAVLAVHPLPSEAVAWIGARADAIAAVGALCFALWAIRPPPGPRPGGRAPGWGFVPDGWGHRAVEIGLLLLALACKEACAGLVPALALARWLRDRSPGALGRAVRWSVPLVGVVGVYAVGRAALLGHTSRYGYLVDDHLGWTWATVLTARVWEMGRVLVPTHLAIDYTSWPYVRTWDAAVFWLAVVAVVGVGWIAWRCRRLAPAVTIGIGWWLCLLLPTSQIVPLNALSADRWLHLPFVGLACVVAAAVAALGRRPWTVAWRWGGGVVALGVLCAAIGATRARAADYRTEASLWGAAAREWPTNASARAAAGGARALLARKQGVRRAEFLAMRDDIVMDMSRVLEGFVSESDAVRVSGNLLAIEVPTLARSVALHGLRSCPDSFVLQVAAAQALWAMGDHAGAEREFATLLARADVPRAAVDRVRVGEMVYVQPEGAPAAGSGAAAAVRAVAWRRLAELRLGADDVAGARAALLEAGRLWPESELTESYLAQLEKNTGDMEAARRRLAALLAKQPTVETPYLQAAEFAIDAGDPEAALAVLAPAARKWPFQYKVWELLSEASFRAGNPRDALYFRSRVVDLLGPAALEPAQKGRG